MLTVSDVLLIYTVIGVKGDKVVNNTGLQGVDDDWYDIVRRSDGYIAYSIPISGRYLIYRINGIVSMRPLLEDEEIFTFNSFMQILCSLGYHITPPADNMISTA